MASADNIVRLSITLPHASLEFHILIMTYYPVTFDSWISLLLVDVPFPPLLHLQISPPTDNGNEVSLPMFDSPPTTPALGTPSVESDAEDNYQYASSRHGFAFPTTPDGSTTSFPSLSPAGPITSKPRAPYRNLSGSFMNDTPDQLGRPNPFIEQVELHHQQTAEQQRRIMDWDELDRAKRATPVVRVSHPPGINSLRNKSQYMP